MKQHAYLGNLKSCLRGDKKSFMTEIESPLYPENNLSTYYDSHLVK